MKDFEFCKWRDISFQGRKLSALRNRCARFSHWRFRVIVHSKLRCMDGGTVTCLAERDCFLFLIFTIGLNLKKERWTGTSLLNWKTKRKINERDKVMMMMMMMMMIVVMMMMMMMMITIIIILKNKWTIRYVNIKYVKRKRRHS